MSANTVYPLEDHYGAEVDELYQRFYVHPNGMVLSENNTMRFFWLDCETAQNPVARAGARPHRHRRVVGACRVHAAVEPRPPEHVHVLHLLLRHAAEQRYHSWLEYGAEVQVPMDEWVKVESYQKLNSYDSSGANRDGVLRVWVNDELAYENTGLAWRSTDGQGIEEAGPHGYDLYQDNDPHSIYFDDHVLLVNGDRDDWQAYEGGSSSGGDGDEETDAGYENELESSRRRVPTASTIASSPTARSKPRTSVRRHPAIRWRLTTTTPSPTSGRPLRGRGPDRQRLGRRLRRRRRGRRVRSRKRRLRCRPRVLARVERRGSLGRGTGRGRLFRTTERFHRRRE